MSDCYEIIKPLDEAKETQFGMPDDVVQGKHGAVPEGYKHVFRQLAFVKDPDVSHNGGTEYSQIYTLTIF
jgi:hypothetical protein